jgi:hypothetical protein
MNKSSKNYKKASYDALLSMCLLPFQSEQNFRIVQNRIVEKQYKTKAVFLFPKHESSSQIEALRNVKDPRKIKSSNYPLQYHYLN